MKKIVCLILASVMSLSILISSNAGSFTPQGYTRVPTSISYKDISHLADVVADVRGKETIIVNATSYQGKPTTWIARIGVATESGEYEYDDYAITTCPYGLDPNTNTVNTLPFSSIDEGRAMYGTSWYYFGIFDDLTNSICGFGIAERIKRWSEYSDLSYTGSCARGIAYTGLFPEACSVTFIQEHTIQK